MILPEDVRRLVDPAIRAAVAASDDPIGFSLEHGERTDWPVRAMAEQIRARPAAQVKCPRLHAAGGLYDTLGIQQCSSEWTAAFKAALTGPIGQGADLCAGIGIDSIGLATVAEGWTACELDPGRAAIATHNLAAMGCDRATTVAGDGLAWLATRPKLDLLYLDPGRRADGGKTRRLADSQPDLVAHAALLTTKADRLLLKLSAGADRIEVMRSYPGLVRWIIVGLHGEAKECVALVTTGVQKSRSGTWTIGAPAPAPSSPAASRCRVSAAIIDDQGVIVEIEATSEVPPERDEPTRAWLGRLHPAVVTAGAGPAACRAHRLRPVSGPWVVADAPHAPGVVRWWRVADARPLVRQDLETELKRRSGGLLDVFCDGVTWSAGDLNARYRLRQGGGEALMLLPEWAVWCSEK